MGISRRDSFKLIGAGLALGTVGGKAAAHDDEDGLLADHVFTSSNAPGGNELLVFGRASGGNLTLELRAATGGQGSGAGTGSQGAVALSSDGRHVHVVNVASNTVTTFALDRRGLRLRSVVDSGGLNPISVTERDGRVYVLNDGGAGNVAGFRNVGGDLRPVPGSVRPLSAAGGTAPAQLSLSGDGDVLVVTEKGTNRLTSYRVARDGGLSAPIVTAGAGVTPFGFAFDRRDRLFVTEAFGGAAGASAVSSYRLEGATPVVLSASVGTTQTAACWLAVTPDGRYAYSANTGSSSVSAYRIDRSGRIELIAAAAGSLGAGSVPIDNAVSADGRRLFVLARGVQSIAVFDIEPDGRLTPRGVGSGLVNGVIGLTAN